MEQHSQELPALLATDLDRHFGQLMTVYQHRLHAFALRHHWQHLVNRTETCDNKVVQVHGVPPQKLVILLN